MTTRILKLEEEDVELIQKLISNIHRNLLNDPNHKVYSPYLLSAHRLHEQFKEGLLTERQYVYALSNAKEAFETADQKAKENRKQARERKLQKSGIKANTQTTEATEPVAEPKRTKVRKAAKPKKKTGLKPIEPCSEHATYSGARSPRTKCMWCWAYYKELHPDRYDEAWNKFKSK